MRNNQSQKREINQNQNHNTVNQRQAQFSEQFEDSNESYHTIDQIIVEPLDEEIKEVNKSKMQIAQVQEAIIQQQQRKLEQERQKIREKEQQTNDLKNNEKLPIQNKSIVLSNYNKKNQFSNLIQEKEKSSGSFILKRQAKFENENQNNQLAEQSLLRDFPDNETREAYNQAIDVYMQQLKQAFGDGQAKQSEEIQVLLRDIRDNSHQKFREIIGNKSGQYQKYLRLLNEQIKTKEKLAFQMNDNLAIVKNQDLLNESIREVQTNLNNGSYTYKNLGQIINDLNEFMETFQNQGVGMEKCFAFTQFLISFQPELINKLLLSIEKNPTTKEEDYSQQEKQYQDEIYQLQEKEAQKEAQISAKEKQIITLNQQIKKIQSAMPDQQSEMDIRASQSGEQDFKNKLRQKDQEIEKLKQLLKGLMTKKKKVGCFG